jgi:hypothetical protein
LFGSEADARFFLVTTSTIEPVARADIDKTHKFMFLSFAPNVRLGLNLGSDSGMQVSFLFCCWSWIVSVHSVLTHIQQRQRALYQEIGAAGPLILVLFHYLSLQRDDQAAASMDPRASNSGEAFLHPKRITFH